MTSTGFEQAFDSVAGAVERAAALPDHRERPVESPEVTHVSPAAEVQVTIADGKVQSMMLNETWVVDTLADDMADLIATTVNDALEKWNELQLEAIQSVTPDMLELHAAISTARQQLQDAWVATLAEVKTP